MNDKNLELEKIYTLAIENQQKGNSEIAEKFYKKILKELPNHVNTQSNLGALYAQTGKSEKALSLLQSVLQIEPNNINACSNLGVVFTQLMEYHKAIDCHKKVLQINPNNADAYNNLGINYKHLGESDLAKSNYYKAIEINPNHANAYNNLGNIYFNNQKNITKAKELYEKAIQLAPNFALGAVLLMQMCETAAPFFDHIEIIESHHDKKLDAPSGTALHTATGIIAARGKDAAKVPTETFTLEGVRGGDYKGIKLHSVRLPGLVAHQEVMFGALGQTLTIRHDSTSRDSFMPGVILAVRKVRSLEGIVIGLDKLLFD